MSALSELTATDLRALSAAIRSGRLRAPFSSLAVGRLVGVPMGDYVAAALSEAAARNQHAALVVPVDLPGLSVAALHTLLAAPAPTHARGQPLLALLPTHLAELAAAYARRGGSVRAFLNEAGSAVTDVGALENLNRPSAAAAP